MSEATVRGHLKTILESVTNIGIVHDYRRLAKTWEAILSLSKTTIGGQEQIRGWEITCEAWSEEYLEPHAESTKKTLMRTYTYKIRGYFGVKDSTATEKTAMIVVEDVMEALNSSSVLHDENVHDGVVYYGQTPPAQLDAFRAQLFGGILCHYAEITQRIQEAIAL